MYIYAYRYNICTYIHIQMYTCIYERYIHIQIYEQYMHFSASAYVLVYTCTIHAYTNQRFHMSTYEPAGSLMYCTPVLIGHHRHAVAPLTPPYGRPRPLATAAAGPPGAWRMTTLALLICDPGTATDTGAVGLAEGDPSAVGVEGETGLYHGRRGRR